MQTLKTAIVVVLLLVVLYGAYDVLTYHEPAAPPDDALAMMDEDALQLPEIEMDTGELDDGTSAGTTPWSAEASSSGVSDPTTSAPGASTELPAWIPPAASTGTDSDPPSSSFTVQPPAGSTLGPGLAAPRTEDSTPTPTVPLPSIGAEPTTPALPHQTNPYVAPNSATNTGTPPATSRPAVPNGQNFGARGYDRARRNAERFIRDGRYYDALNELSIFYKSMDLTEQEHRELVDLLDPLAGRVIYSREHMIVDPYRVGRNETLMQIAEQYQVPWQLLMNINGIENPRVLLPGTELKVVRGPFRAEIDVQTKEMTLFVGTLYAGRFPLSVGLDAQPLAGTYEIRDKQRSQPYFANGISIPGGNPNNPYGNAWLDLGQQMSIHGSPTSGPTGKGCFSLSPQDARDVYGILSVGSKVRVIR